MLHISVPGVQKVSYAAQDLSRAFLSFNYLKFFNFNERLRTLGTPSTQYEATGRLVNERLDGGHPFFLRERKSIGDGCCTRIKNALSAVKNIHLLQKNSAPLLILHLFILIY